MASGVWIKGNRGRKWQRCRSVHFFCRLRDHTVWLFRAMDWWKRKSQEVHGRLRCATLHRRWRRRRRRRRRRVPRRPRRRRWAARRRRNRRRRCAARACATSPPAKSPPSNWTWRPVRSPKTTSTSPSCRPPNASCPVAWVSFLFDFIIYIFFYPFSSMAIVHRNRLVAGWSKGIPAIWQRCWPVLFLCRPRDHNLWLFRFKVGPFTRKMNNFHRSAPLSLIFFYHQMISNKNRSQFSPMKVCNQMTLQSNLNWSGNGQLLRLCAVALLRRTTFVTFDRLK